jgi:TonB family protein
MLSRLSRRSLVVLVGLTATVASCDAASDTIARWRGPDTSLPDTLPQLLNDSLPFTYPVGLYVQLINDSVTLRLHIDEFGMPVAESTKVERGAKYVQFDSSALAGSRQLRFRPAKRRGRAVPFTVLFPIQFRVPVVPDPPATTARPDSTKR